MYTSVFLRGMRKVNSDRAHDFIRQRILDGQELIERSLRSFARSDAGRPAREPSADELLYTA